MRVRPSVRGLLVLLCVSVCAPSATLADERSKGGDPAPQRELLGAPQLSGDDSLLPYPREGDAERTSAIRKGLAWLASRQSSRDGSIEVGDAEPGQRAPLAVTSLAALAWMSGGSTLTRGEHQDNVKRAVEYLLASTHRGADDFPGFIEDRGDNISRTHGHGLATLALAQAYTVSPNTPLGKRIGETLLIAIGRIQDSQGAEGGWYYSAGRSIQHEGSVTVAMVQALRAANDVGIRVDPGVVAEAVKYVTRLQVMELPEEEDPAVDDPQAERKRARQTLGGFKYGLDDPQTSIALTAAGLVTLQASGTYDGPRIEEGYDYIWRKLLERTEDGAAAADPFPYYERFYLSQALWHHRDTSHYRRWAEPLMRELCASQESSGSWQDVRFNASGRRFLNRYGAGYATASNVLFLALPDDTLPLFHR